MKKEFKSLPLDSPESILDSVYNGERSQIEELEKVLDKPIDVKEYINNLTREDELTKAIYEKSEDGDILFPSKDDVKIESIIKGKVGDQKNIYHKEDIGDNTKSTMLKLIGKDIEGESKTELALMGLLSQEGKKYSAISKNGEIRFDEPEKLSAYLAARRYRDIGIDKDKAKPFVVAIYYQNIQKGDWDINIQNRKQLLLFKKDLGQTYEKTFVDRFGKRAEGLTKALSEANNGFVTEKSLNENKNILNKADTVLNTSLLRYIDRSGIPPALKGKVDSLEQLKVQKRADKNIEKNNKDIQRQTDERLRQEQERIRRERERQEWIQYEKEKEIYDRQLMKGIGALVTVTVAAPEIGRLIAEKTARDPREKIGEQYLDKLIENKSNTRIQRKEEKMIARKYDKNSPEKAQEKKNEAKEHKKKLKERFDRTERERF